jgi:hypothetical protein
MKTTAQCLAAVLLLAVATTADAADKECLVTEPNDGSFYSNDSLKASIGGAHFIFEPGGPGFVDYDGALGIKFAFVRLIPGRVHVGGRRLDGEAGPARAYIYDYPYDSGYKGFQPISLVFPTPGCWEISGGVSGQRLTFVLLVEKVGEGPDWRLDGPPLNRRVTTSWRE